MRGGEAVVRIEPQVWHELGVEGGVADGGMGDVQVRRQPPARAARHLHRDRIDGVKVHARACARLMTKERTRNMLRRDRERRGDRVGQRCERWHLPDVNRDAALVQLLCRLRRHVGGDLAAIEALEAGDHRRRMAGEEFPDVPRRQRQDGSEPLGRPGAEQRTPAEEFRAEGGNVGGRQPGVQKALELHTCAPSRGKPGSRPCGYRSPASAPRLPPIT